MAQSASVMKKKLNKSRRLTMEFLKYCEFHAYLPHNFPNNNARLSTNKDIFCHIFIVVFELCINEKAIFLFVGNVFQMKSNHRGMPFGCGALSSRRLSR